MKMRMLKLMKLIQVLKKKKEILSTKHVLHMGNARNFPFTALKMPTGSRNISVMANWTKLDLPPVFLPEKIPMLKPIGETDFKSLNGAHETFNSKMSDNHCFFTGHDTVLGILVVHELMFRWFKLSGQLNPASYLVEEVAKAEEERGQRSVFVLNQGSYSIRGATLEPIVVSSSGKTLTPLETSIRKIACISTRLPRFDSPMNVFLKVFAHNAQAQAKDDILILQKLEYSVLGGGKLTPVLYCVKKRVL